MIMAYTSTNAEKPSSSVDQDLGPVMLFKASSKLNKLVKRSTG